MMIVHEMPTIYLTCLTQTKSPPMTMLMRKMHVHVQDDHSDETFHEDEQELLPGVRTVDHLEVPQHDWRIEDVNAENCHMWVRMIVKVPAKCQPSSRCCRA